MFALLGLMFLLGCGMGKKKEFNLNQYPFYNGLDLGATYSSTKTSFRVWAPTASSVTLRLYNTGLGGAATQEVKMDKSNDGTWIAIVEGDIKNQYYTYQATINGIALNEVADPYARTTGANGLRGMVVDLGTTNPVAWENDVRPALKNFNDIIIWEMHVRDFSINANSGIKNRGKYLGLTETGTTSPKGQKTGLDHIVDLGVTHVHLLPVFDFQTIDETKLNTPQYNWGYDPQNYNVPEGSYSTNPYDGNVRVTEFKQMVQALHAKGIRVIMDVVYNHTAQGNSVPFEQLVPGYYYRKDSLGQFSNGSGCGNETASNHPMFQKYMVESLVYWAQEYHIDGFRFDLMAIHDIETMNLIRAELSKVDSTIFLYGEGWMASKSPLRNKLRASKENTYLLNDIAVFSDEIRDGLRGRWMEANEKGYICGNPKLTESIKYGIVGGIKHSQIDYSKVIYGGKSYVSKPSQFIDYVSCHDNPCLWDKIAETAKDLPEIERIKIQKLANGIVLTSQGVPFLHSGEEMVRTKQMVENSYNAPDSINNLDWSRKSTYIDVYNYYKKMIALRKNHPAFRMETSIDINNNLTFLKTHSSTVIAYKIGNNANGDAWCNIIVAINSSAKNDTIELPNGKWQLVADGDAISEDGIDKKVYTDKIIVPSRTLIILRSL